MFRDATEDVFKPLVVDVDRGRKQFWKRGSRLARTGGSSPSLGSECNQKVLDSCETWIIGSRSVPKSYYEKRAECFPHSQLEATFTFVHIALSSRVKHL
jgi:hypothetical protein